MAAISMELIKKLRDWSSAGFLDCRAALQEADGDLDKAMEILRKRRTDIASSKAHRETKNGMVFSLIEGGKGVVAEVNCETDFAARSDLFRGFMKDLVKHLLETPEAKAGELMESASVSAMIKDTVGKLGENMSMRRVTRYDLKGNGLLHTYMHVRDAGGVPSLAVLVELSTDTEAGAANPMVREFANNLCLHAAAAAPRWLAPEEVPADVVEKEKEIYRVQLAESGKGAEIVEKILPGKVAKFYEDNCLMNQVYSLAADKSEQKPMAALLKDLAGKVGESIKVTRFVRMDLGGV